MLRGITSIDTGTLCYGSGLATGIGGTVMRLANDAGQSVTLKLLGYEGDDRQWLVVRGEVDDGSRPWRFEQPCLRPRDVRTLAKWLRRWADGKTQRTRMEFLEPNLAFEVTGGSGDRPVLKITFELEARPPWNHRAQTDDDRDSIWLEFPLTSVELRATADRLHRDLAALEDQGIKAAWTA